MEFIKDYRNDYSVEADFVLEFRNGKYALPQTKLSDNFDNEAIKSMNKIYDLLMKK